MLVIKEALCHDTGSWQRASKIADIWRRHMSVSDDPRFMNARSPVSEKNKKRSGSSRSGELSRHSTLFNDSTMSTALRGFLMKESTITVKTMVMSRDRMNEMGFMFMPNITISMANALITI